MTGLTGRGVAVLVAGAGLLLAGLAAGYPVLTGLGAAAGAALAGAVLVTVARPKLTVRREVRPDRVTVGEPAQVRLTVTNHGGRPARGCELVEHAGGAPLRVRVPVLVAGAGGTVELAVPTPRRGLVRLGPVALELRDPLGLVRRTRPVAGTGWLWVHPRTYPTRSLPLGRVLDFEGRLAEQPLAGSTAFAALREYRHGDDPRHIHWRSTARTGTLVVREQVDTADPATAIVLDTRADRLPGARFEAAIEVAASIATAARRAGQRVSLAAPGEDQVGVVAAGGFQVADRLAALTASPDPDPAELLRLVAQSPPGGALVLISAPEPGLVARLAPARRHFPQVVLVLLTGAGAEGGDDQPAAPVSAGARLAVVRAGSAPAAVAGWSRLARTGRP